MISVDIYVPSIDREYDFGLDEHVPVSMVIEEIATMINQKEQCVLEGNPEELMLCVPETQIILPLDKTLNQCMVATGTRLLLV